MTIFDQRGQQVTYQYNAAGDINFGAVQNRIDVIGQLEKLKAEVGKARDAGILDAEVATDATYQMDKALFQARKDAPNQQRMLDYINGAKALIETTAAASGLVSGFVAAAEAVQTFFR